MSTTDYQASLAALDPRNERRFYLRSAPSRPIYVPFGASNLCMLLNLSENGFLVSTPAGLNPNSVYRVTLRLNGLANPIEVPVRTVWTTESGERAGIQLLDLSDHDREQIRKWQALEGARAQTGDLIAPPVVTSPIGTPPVSAAASVQAAPKDKIRPAQTLEETVAEAVAPPPVPVSAPPPKRPPAPRLAAAARSTVPLISQPLPNTHLQALPVPTAIVARTRRKKSEAGALLAWILVGAITCAGIAFLMRPDLFGKILVHSPKVDSPAVAEAPADAPSPLKELEARNLPATTKPAGGATAAPVDPANNSPATPVARSTAKVPAPEQRAPEKYPSPDNSASARSHFAVASPSRPILNGSPATSSATIPAGNADPENAAAAANPTARDANSNTDANRAAAASSKTSAGDTQMANATPSTVTTAPMTTPAPAPVTSPVAPSPSAKSAITGSIVESSPRANANNDVAVVPPATASNSTPPRSTWGSSGPTAAGRSSILRSRPDPGASPVVQMDVAENRVMEISPPRSITSSYVTLPGERVLETSGVTMHIRRAVRVPPERWIWRSKKRLVVGELTSRVDPQGGGRGGPGFGSVTLQVMIDKDGSIGEMKPLNGPSALLPSVTRAVREWHYEPSYLDGKPIETRAEIEVNFHPSTNGRP